jgi:putative flippase GtrA
MADRLKQGRALLARLRQSTLLRFLMVGGFGELLYFGLYTLFWHLSGQRAPLAIAIAGSLSLVANTLLHARLSFRVSFRGVLLLRYGVIQLVCLALSVALGSLLQRLGVQGLLIGVLSGLAWTVTSFLLSRRAFGASGVRPRSAGADRRPPGCG